MNEDEISMYFGHLLKVCYNRELGDVKNKKTEGKDPKITWKFLEKNLPDFNPVTGNCHLCTREKFQFVFNPSVATLNHRTEIFASCHLRSNYIIGPVNPKSTRSTD